METVKEVPHQTTLPNIIVADATSLAYIVLIGQLPLLHMLGDTVLLIDVVAGEAAYSLPLKDAATLTQWNAAGAGESSHPVRVDRTGIKQALPLARREEPQFRAPRASEVVTTDWLVAAIKGTVRSAVILIENNRVSRIVVNQVIDADISVVNTRALLALAERRGLLSLAEATWRAMSD